MYWLRYGWYFPPTHEFYSELFKDTLKFWSPTQITLHDLFMRPISLKLVPMQGVVIGLLIASLVSIPILVSILYRFGASVPFCVMVSFLAVMPWLGVTLLLSCAIAAYGRIKLKFRFAAALLGLVPIGVYFFMASRGSVVPEDVLRPQIERGLVVAPLLLSALGSCALMVTVLAIAKIVDYRPGAIAPLLAIMFLTPWFLFMSKVGRDELHYRLFEQDYGPQSKAYFANADANFAIRKVAAELWSGQDEPKPTIDVLEDRVRWFFESQLDPIRKVDLDEVSKISNSIEAESLEHLKLFARGQYRVALESDKFIRDFPSSRYEPCVLYIKGRALDMRVDTHLFRLTGALRFYHDFPNEASRSTWIALSESKPESPLARVARCRLGQLDARKGRIDQAIARLAEGIGSAGNQKRGQADRPTLENLLAKKPAEASLESEYMDLEHRAAALLSLLRRNREAVNGDAPLIAYLNCNPRHANYHQNLREILERFGRCKISDNVELQLALAEPSAADRIRALQKLHRRFPDGDALPEVLYELGAALVEQGKRTEAENYFKELTEKFPDSRFASAARHVTLLGSLSSRGRLGG